MRFVSFGKETKQIAQFKTFFLCKEAIKTVKINCILIEIAFCVFNFNLILTCRFNRCWIDIYIHLLSQTNKFLMSNLASVDSANKTSPIVYKRTILAYIAFNFFEEIPSPLTSFTLANSCSLFSNNVALSRLFWTLSNRRSCSCAKQALRV